MAWISRLGPAYWSGPGTGFTWTGSEWEDDDNSQDDELIVNGSWAVGLRPTELRLILNFPDGALSYQVFVRDIDYNDIGSSPPAETYAPGPTIVDIPLSFASAGDIARMFFFSNFSYNVVFVTEIAVPGPDLFWTEKVKTIET